MQHNAFSRLSYRRYRMTQLIAPLMSDRTAVTAVLPLSLSRASWKVSERPSLTRYIKRLPPSYCVTRSFLAEAMMLTLWHCADARSLRVLWALEELELRYELK